jgi:hypothetical protein
MAATFTVTLISVVEERFSESDRLELIAIFQESPNQIIATLV